MRGDLWPRSLQRIPGGVNSPVRSFTAVGGTPVFMARGSGPFVWDVDGQCYVDLCLSWGALPLGHAHPDVVAAVCRAAEMGTTFGTATEGEVELAELVSSAMPSVEMLRLCSSGTEAVMSAIRLARAFTGRSKILKFAGGYHGHADSLLVQAGSGALTGGVPSSPGVTRAVSGDTLVCPYNDLDAVEEICAAWGTDIAAIIVEPVAANMGLVAPVPGFLQALRRVVDRVGALLIFDEVITGFRLGWGGAQAMFDVRADLTCLGKVLGGGMPLAGYGGRTDIMRQVAPSGPVYQAGTLSGNPVAVAAGLATLRLLQRPGVYVDLAARTVALSREWQSAADRAGISCSVVHTASLLTPFFRAEAPTSLGEVLQSDVKAYAAFFHAMLARGVYLPPAQFEVGFMSLSHGPEEIASVAAAAEGAFACLRDGGQ